jgi:hypothetical protein
VHKLLLSLTTACLGLSLTCAAGELPTSPDIEDARAITASGDQTLSRQDLEDIKAIAQKHMYLDKGELKDAHIIATQAEQFATASKEDEAMVHKAAEQAMSGSQNGHGEPTKYAQFKTLVFISLSMPERSLRELFKQAAGDPSIGFVVRGFKDGAVNPNMMFNALKAFNEMMPSTESSKQAIVFLDPLLFHDYFVDKVPFTLHQAHDGKWYGLWGEISVAGARQMIEEGRGGRNRPPVGPVYSILERDFQEVIREKFNNFDWAKSKRDALAHARHFDLRLDLPVASMDRERIVDISAPLQADVTGPDGSVLVAAGTMINTLKYVNIGRPLAIFDPDSKAQVRQALAWQKQLPNVILVATHYDSEVLKKFDGPGGVFALDPLLKKRFQIEVAPSLVEQVGDKLRITERRPGV